MSLREISAVFLCRIGQETVQDIVTRTMEIFQMSRATQLGQPVHQDRLVKLQENLRQVGLLFRKLRLLHERCLETEDRPPSPHLLVPYVGQDPVLSESCSAAAVQERSIVLEMVRQKNQEMKCVMDQMRNLLWDVNAMLTHRN